MIGSVLVIGCNNGASLVLGVSESGFCMPLFLFMFPLSFSLRLALTKPFPKFPPKLKKPKGQIKKIIIPLFLPV
eukprot:CAMPEP_0204830336 /NCGR_PEP_ID=MMETSP1346-20131115/8474_1 /ASSEMBLY_ACC=CAM_ASM_000771 /TAXON_ID=215587 /ORGANISM="Aplanochytrium stocchinoi, Strain GSBS06" /LENGTH=73 /DNA_ID=CAMNT_0051960515 /DNA_START=1398 /DNA_END=1619 /DNA_ORIENTATION=+